jgi:hypothetical protein
MQKPAARGQGFGRSRDGTAMDSIRCNHECQVETGTDRGRSPLAHSKVTVCDIFLKRAGVNVVGWVRVWNNREVLETKAFII